MILYLLKSKAALPNNSIDFLLNTQNYKMKQNDSVLSYVKKIILCMNSCKTHNKKTNIRLSKDRESIIRTCFLKRYTLCVPLTQNINMAVLNVIDALPDGLIATHI